MKAYKEKTRLFLLAKRLFFLALVFLVLFVPFGKSSQNEGGMYEITAFAYGDSPTVEIERYDVDMTLQTDRKICVKKQIRVRFLKSVNMFYHPLATDAGMIYSDIEAKCEGNEDFYYEVAENPDMDGFIDINCMGATQEGKVWTYEYSYTMTQNTAKFDHDISLNVVEFGSAFAYHDVTVNLHFPAEIAEDYKVYTKRDSDKADVNLVEKTLSEDGKTLTLHADILDLVYNEGYGEYMARGMTVAFSLPQGTLEPYAKIALFTDDIWKILIGGFVVVGLAFVALVFCRKKHEIISVVNVKAPDDMDPLKMGKWLDGVVDDEDVTSILYYFANKGYLMINVENEDDPILLKKVQSLPEDAPLYQKTLFKGLFQSGESVAVSDLAEKYYETVAKAKLQLPSPKMYDKKSVLGFLSGGALGILFAFFVPFLMAFGVHKGYVYPYGFLFAIPVIGIVFLEYLRESYRYKWKPVARLGVFVAQITVAVAFTLLCLPFFATHIMTVYEVLLLCVIVFAGTFIALPTLSRKKEYVDELGEILGFKDFIVYTEEDKIKFMLEENPELYYKVLPYAQVLGVTKAWQDKFERILLQPPSWATGTNMSMFDYMIFHRCMISAMHTAMKPPQSSAGQSGGGGSFGSFGGGGMGGGGFGTR